jgi:integrase
MTGSWNKDYPRAISNFACHLSQIPIPHNIAKTSINSKKTVHMKAHIQQRGTSMAKRSHGDGGIDQRGDNIYRLRYRVGGKRFAVTFHGTLTEARKELRRLIRSGDVGEHVAPDKITVWQWCEQWIAAGAPGRKKRRVGQRSLERYEQVLNIHVKPALGNIALQKLAATMIDKLYADIAAKGEIAPRTAHLIHVVLGACLATAHRKGEIANNPMAKVEQVPNLNPQPEDGEGAEVDAIGEGLSETELTALIKGFEPSTSLYPIVALAAATGARRNELLALRWTDLDVENKKLRIERALEQTVKFGIRVKPPKTKRGFRTIDLDDATVAMLLAERATHQRLLAGIPDGVAVDLGLIRLPANALIFPATPKDFDLGKWRNPHTISKLFARRAEAIGFGKTRFHDLRGIHATALLDAGIPVHTVAQRIGDDPAILLRAYTKRQRSKAADKALASALASFSGGFLKA